MSMLPTILVIQMISVENKLQNQQKMELVEIIVYGIFMKMVLFISVEQEKWLK